MNTPITLPFDQAAPRRLAPGLALAAAVAAFAWWLGDLAPLIGAPVIGIVLGLAVRNLAPPGARFTPGLAFAGKEILKASVVMLGFGLSLGQIASVGGESLAVTLVTLSVAFASAWLLGRWLKVHAKLAVLIGVGTAICGGSAIAAVTPIIRSEDHDTAFAISTIFLFNVIAVLLFPLLGHLLHLSDLGFGLWAGTAINDTSSVVAAGYSYSHAAGDYATVVKLTRATLIIPVCLVLALAVAARAKRGGVSDFNLRRIFPWFILWFVVASAVRTAGVIPAAVLPALHAASVFLIVLALTAIGLTADLRRMIASGPRPILLGLGVWAAVAISSLGMQYVMGSL